MTPSFPPKLGETTPELHELRDRLLAGVVCFDDLPEVWGRLLFNLPDDATAWSRTDALLIELVTNTGELPMSDLSDLCGIYPTALRWNAENGVLGRGVFDETTGERTIEEIELGGNRAKFALDLATRERGYGYIRTGIYDMRLSPVGQPAPAFPGEDFKPALGCWVWNPAYGELRLETVQATLVRAIGGVWDRARSFKEATAGLQPVIHFAGRYEQYYRTIDKTFFAPQINIVGWVDRDKVPCFTMRPATVKPPMELDSQVSHALLEEHQQQNLTPLQSKVAEKLTEKPARIRRGAAAKSKTTGDVIDDKIPF